jgi:hypothetical protein
MNGARACTRERRRVSRQVRRTPTKRGFDESIVDDEERDVVIGGDDKPAGQGQ